MSTKNVLQKLSGKVSSRTIPFREMLSDFHSFGEDLNMDVARDRVLNHSTPIKHTRVLLEDGVTHLFECDGFVMTIDFQLTEGGRK